MWKLTAAWRISSHYTVMDSRSMMKGSIRYTLGISSGIVSHRRTARSLKKIGTISLRR